MDNDGTKPLIFISYRADDEKLARAFVNAIQSDFLGFPEVFYASALEPGGIWKEAIRNKLKRASLVCVFCSERTQTRWISMEVGAAWVSGLPLIPICYGDQKKNDLPDVLADRQAVDVTSKDDLKKLYVRIAEVLQCNCPSLSNTLITAIGEFRKDYKPLPESTEEILRKSAEQPSGLPEYHAKQYRIMDDTTVKAWNPLTGTLVWTVPGRKRRPGANLAQDASSLVDQQRDADSFCDFCNKNYYLTTPEKSRIAKINDNYELQDALSADDVFSSNTAEFRRVANLFEILSFEYWEKNYGFEPDTEVSARKEGYMGSSTGEKHVRDTIERKRSLARGEGADDESMQNALFAGSHDLIIAKSHLRKGAVRDNEHSGSGDLTPEEHFQYFRLTIEAMHDFYAHNKYIKYVTVFQNWLRPAGATIDHLHKQIVGIDEFGIPVERAIRILEEEPDFFNQKLRFASERRWILAENKHAVAYVESGRRYPTVAIYSKQLHFPSKNGVSDSVRGISDLVHACHAALGSDIPTNEEWYCTPPDAERRIPWHILILLRENIQAGFEHATRIHINSYPPYVLRKYVSQRLDKLIRGRVLGDIYLGEMSGVPFLEM